MILAMFDLYNMHYVTSRSMYPCVVTGGTVLPEHQAAGRRHLHARQLRHPQVRHRQLGHGRQRVQAHRHRRQRP